MVLCDTPRELLSQWDEGAQATTQAPGGWMTGSKGSGGGNLENTRQREAAASLCCVLVQRRGLAVLNASSRVGPTRLLVNVREQIEREVQIDIPAEACLIREAVISGMRTLDLRPLRDAERGLPVLETVAAPFSPEFARQQLRQIVWESMIACAVVLMLAASSFLHRTDTIIRSVGTPVRVR